VDTFVCAEFSDDAEVFATQKKFMVHSPCGRLCPAAPCMQDGNCSKSFPKQYQEETVVSENGHYIYRRHNNGNGYVDDKTGLRVTNERVVPHNIYLLMKYQCHMNVEACASIGSVKYLHKGSDMAIVMLENVDEYISGRYIGPSEGCWSAFGFKTYSRFPNVVRLSLNLPDENEVRFDERDDAVDVVGVAGEKRTKLEMYFHKNVNSRQYTYLFLEL